MRNPSRRLQWPGDAGHPRLEGGSWGTGMAYHREPAVYPDLAVLCTNARRNLELLEALGQKAARPASSSSQPEQYPALLECAARYQMRLLGPNSLGLLAPWQGLNASFSPVPIHRGKLAFISQSAAVSNTILDWAQQREMGFSYFIALGDSLDIDVDDLLDFGPRGKIEAPFCCTSSISATRAPLVSALNSKQTYPRLKAAVVRRRRSYCNAWTGWTWHDPRHSARWSAAGAGYP